MSKFMKLSEQKRYQMICEAAFRVFSAKGFANTTMEDIAHEAGMSKGGIYFHFSSKEVVLVEALKYSLQTFRVALDSELAHIAEPEQRLLRYIQRYIEDINVMLLSPAEFWVEAMRLPVIRDLLREDYRIARQEIGEMLQAISPPSLRYEHEELSVLIVAALDGIMLQKLLDPSAIDLIRLNQTIMRWFTNLVTLQRQKGALHIIVDDGGENHAAG